MQYDIYAALSICNEPFELDCHEASLRRNSSTGVGRARSFGDCLCDSWGAASEDVTFYEVLASVFAPKSNLGRRATPSIARLNLDGLDLPER
ncbi:MAG: hypothetical protein ACREEH_10275, partial [Caulobacteraceae bacterium]